MKILAVLCLFLFITSVILFIEVLKSKLKYKKLKIDTKTLIRTLEGVRYGKLNLRAELSNKKLEWSVNRLIETLEDREIMINEYQKNLSEKNVSLEKMIFNEKESQKFKEDFIATLTHDMKTPVIAELNTLDFLLEGRFGELNEKQRQAIELMKNSNKELIELAEILLETYKMQQSELILNKQKTDIDKLLSDIVGEMLPIAQNSNIKIIINKKFKNLEAHIDAFQIKRVLKNLISNAISFSPSSSEILLESQKDTSYLKIAVTNHGQGISEEDLALIFKKYYSGVKKFRKIGTGLGLYLSNQIIKAHNGCIRVNSIKNDKTTFEIEIPID